MSSPQPSHSTTVHSEVHHICTTTTVLKRKLESTELEISDCNQCHSQAKKICKLSNDSTQYEQSLSSLERDNPIQSLKQSKSKTHVTRSALRLRQFRQKPEVRAAEQVRDTASRRQKRADPQVREAERELNTASRQQKRAVR